MYQGQEKTKKSRILKGTRTSHRYINKTTNMHGHIGINHRS